MHNSVKVLGGTPSTRAMVQASLAAPSNANAADTTLLGSFLSESLGSSSPISYGFEPLWEVIDHHSHTTASDRSKLEAFKFILKTGYLMNEELSEWRVGMGRRC